MRIQDLVLNINYLDFNDSIAQGEPLDILEDIDLLDVIMANLDKKQRRPNNMVDGRLNNNPQNKILKIPNFVPLKNWQKLVDFWPQKILVP